MTDNQMLRMLEMISNGLVKMRECDKCNCLKLLTYIDMIAEILYAKENTRDGEILSGCRHEWGDDTPYGLHPICNKCLTLATHIELRTLDERKKGCR